MILMSFCSKFIGYICVCNYFSTERFDRVIAKIKWCSIFCPTVYVPVSNINVVTKLWNLWESNIQQVNGTDGQVIWNLEVVTSVNICAGIWC